MEDGTVVTPASGQFVSDEEMVLGDASYASIVVMREKPKRFFRTLAQKGHKPASIGKLSPKLFTTSADVCFIQPMGSSSSDSTLWALASAGV